MGDTESFKGFSKDTISFYRNLSINNEKVWFEEHRNEYEDNVLQPARDFVYEMGKKLKTIRPDIIFDARINKSIFRIYRDVRFSKDKSPYKTHLAILFWEGPLKKMESSGFYFHLEPDRLMLGAGIYMFSKPILEEYRKSVVDDRYGNTLFEAIDRIDKNNEYVLGGKHYKRIPRGYDASNVNSEYLLFNGLHYMYETEIPDELFSEKIIDYCFNIFVDMMPIHKWLVDLTNRV